MMNYKVKIRQNKGITLIALVITIIVLLILAGVSIATLTGENGVLTKANDAKTETKQANAEEQVKITVLGSYGENGILDYEKLRDNLNQISGITEVPDTITDESFPFIVTIDGYNITIESGGIVSKSFAGTKYEKEETITVGGTTVTVPEKFTISGIAKESTVNSGLVIYLIPEGEPEITDWEADTDNNGIIDVQEKYDQFVWVPVPNAVLDLSNNETALLSESNIKAAVQEEIDVGRYPMAIKKDDTNYFGVLYEFSLDSTTNKVKVDQYSLWTPLSTSHREPAYLEDTTYGDGSDENNVGITESSLQNEYNTMVNKVANEKGFWVGRYETSNMSASNSNDSSQQIKVIKGTTTGMSVVFYRMYAQQKNYSKLALGGATTTTSSMIWGSQWDQIMIWMKNVKNSINTTNGEYYVINSVGMGNFGNMSEVDDGWDSKVSPAPTGYQENYKVKNIYDLAGNESDWTLEAVSPRFRIWRRKLL